MKDIKTVEYQFRPIGDDAFFFGYQLIVTVLNKDAFTIEQSYPIKESATVVVDLALENTAIEDVLHRKL